MVLGQVCPYVFTACLSYRDVNKNKAASSEEM